MSEERSFGYYRVSGKRAYRGHEPGATFTAQIPRAAEQRAIIRGDIKLLEWITPMLEERSFTFPEGWLPSHNQSTGAPKGASLVQGGR